MEAYRSKPRYDLYLSYSGRRTYLLCPRKYEFSYVHRLPKKWNVKDTAFGSSIGKVFEWFYNRRLWASKNVVASTVAVIDSAVSSVFQEEGLDVADHGDLRRKLVQDLREYVPKTLETIRKHKLLTYSSRSEVDLTVVYTSPKHGATMKIGGRSDFVHSISKSVSIMDGKASRHRDKYVDSDQLVWYAILHYIRFGVAPARLGFLYYLFPDDPVQWISYDADSMRSVLDSAFEISEKVRLKIFPPTPGGECSRCDYLDRCQEGRDHVAFRKAESSERLQSSVFDLDVI